MTVGKKTFVNKEPGSTKSLGHVPDDTGIIRVADGATVEAKVCAAVGAERRSWRFDL